MNQERIGSVAILRPIPVDISIKVVVVVDMCLEIFPSEREAFFITDEITAANRVFKK